MVCLDSLVEVKGLSYEVIIKRLLEGVCVCAFVSGGSVVGSQYLYVEVQY
jgi:hypothetical protein